ncbi:MAG: tripartite tricarboxylate transporter TctB family protein [Spirochaetaceae bacterium]|nr:tripartite tricarboxylate transporter TctB family protein [Spirochaetaceae bacterium]
MKKFLDSVDLLIDNTGTKLERHNMNVPINIVGAILFIIIAIVGLSLVPSQIKLNTSSAITARTFPLLMLRIVLIFSVVLLLKDIIAIIRKKDIEMKEINLLVEIRALIILAMLILFLVLLHFSSFIASSIVFGILMLFYFRSRKLSSYIIICSSAIIIGFLFQYVLKVRLP